MKARLRTMSSAIALLAALPAASFASGHGLVFGAATPTLGRGGWSLDQAWTIRTGDEQQRQQMLKTMLSFGVTETIQVSGSLPLMMGDGRLAPARMMSPMSSDREFEGLMAWRFQRRTVGIGGRQESTFYIGGTARHWSGVATAWESDRRSRARSLRDTPRGRTIFGSAARCSATSIAMAIVSATHGW